jgi:hypothetical protein
VKQLFFLSKLKFSGEAAVFVEVEVDPYSRHQNVDTTYSPNIILAADVGTYKNFSE